VTVRGTYSTAFRAPSIGELYAGNAESFPSFTDPCAGNPVVGGPGYINPASTVGLNCGAAVNNGDVSTQLKETLGGNAKLKPETATIFTVGLVLEPRMVDGLSFTIDYYDTTVKKTIGAIGIGTILNGAYDPNGPGNGQFQGLVTRSATTQYILNVNDTNQNVGELRTSGLDLAGRYLLTTSSFGKFAFTAEGTLLLKDDWLRPDGSIVHARGTYDFGYADPKFKGIANVQWGMSGLTAGFGARYIGGFKECGDNLGNSGGYLCADTPTYFHMVSSYWNWNANVGYGFTSPQGKTTITAGVTNLMNQNPPKNFNAFANTADTSYDYMGRFYYARLNHSF
jgi:outer membrane receptor protein involved in Fe transport